MNKKKYIRFLLGLVLALFLTACAGEIPTEHTNIQLNYGAFQIGDTIYHKTVSGLHRYHADAPNVMDHFCYDPLCDHSGEDGVCPDCWNLDGGSYVTDGERIYMNARSFLSALNGGTWNRYERCIYSFLPDGSDMKLHVTYDSTNEAQTNLSCRDGYIYFYQSYYEEEYDPAMKGNQDQYVKLMRLNTATNEVEEALSAKLLPENRVYLDDRNYYVLHMDNSFLPEDGTLDIFDRESGEAIVEDYRPDDKAVVYVTDYRGETYFICYESRESREYGSTVVLISYALYRYDDGECEKLIGGIGDLTGIVFTDGAIWYEPFAFTHIGTKELPTGVGEETSPYDFCRFTDGTLARYDIATGSTQIWSLPTMDEGDEASFYGISDGIAIIEISNTEKDFTEEPYDAGIYSAELGNDGMLRLIEKKIS